ncbi:MAG: hypothetical protein KF830_06435 [Planctomycetes bacterium]|nr:hypothetical protein [Planctomycetota bacterium]
MDLFLSTAICTFVIVSAVDLYRRFKRLERRVETLERRSHKADDRGENVA